MCLQAYRHPGPRGYNPSPASQQCTVETGGTSIEKAWGGSSRSTCIFPGRHGARPRPNAPRTQELEYVCFGRCKDSFARGPDEWVMCGHPWGRLPWHVWRVSNVINCFARGNVAITYNRHPFLVWSFVMSLIRLLYRNAHCTVHFKEIYYLIWPVECSTNVNMDARVTT